MGSVHETVKTVNSSLRTLIALVLVVAAAVLGYQGYEIYNEPNIKLQDKQVELDNAKIAFEKSQEELKQTVAANSELRDNLAQTEEQLAKLDTALRLLKVNRRLAELRVLEQTGAGEGETLQTRVSFVETNEEGEPIGATKEFVIDGDLVYVDYLVAKFDDKYVEQADLDRATAICLFQRIFGENQEPSEGYQLDEAGTRPTAYGRGGIASDFEKQIWADFWTIANDPQKAQELGIRAAHGNAASIRVQPEKAYQLDLRSTGEFSLRPLPAQAAKSQ